MNASALGVLVLGSALSALSRGQAIDTVMFRDSADAKPFTIIDQIENPQERRAFLKLYGARDPKQRHELAEAFVLNYPQSWLLAQAYEIDAKACIELNEYARAIPLGQQALRLFPENPVLLVPLANVQVQLQQFTAAEESARAALDYLDQFDRPAAITAAEWPRTLTELKASSYFVLGRVATARAVRGAGSEKQQGLLRAENFLLQARDLNAGDPEISYLLGLTELWLGKQKQAAFCFKEAWRMPGPLQAKALENLRRIYDSSIREAAISFDGFVAAVELPAELKAGPTAASVSVSAHFRAGGYAGSQACQPCHAAIYDSWQKTGMRRMLRAYRPENVIGDFRVHNQFSDETGAVVARMSMGSDKHHFAVRDKAGDWRTYPVDYTIGSKWQQAYATRLPSGDIHVFPIQYNAIRKKWINYWKVIDPPGSPRAVVTLFNQLGTTTSYQINCAPCHTSQLRATKQDPSSGHDFEFRETGINCEMCHGPAQDHALAMTSGQRYAKNALEPPVDFRNISAREYIAICGQCHAQSALHQQTQKGEINYATQSASFFPAQLSQPFGDVSRRAFYKDGRFRETTFIAEAFRRTACFRKGQAHCGYCHQPHAPDAAVNPTSLKFPNDPDRMCLQCHGRFTTNPSAHTHHPASAEASRCVSCHMPPIMNSVLFRARTHQIDDIPNTEMTARFGAEESPNACLLCHSDKGVGWVKLRLQTW
jgi:tetratricopeptide (TPR) repeat protein